MNPGAAEVEAVERPILHSFPANVRELDRVVASIGPEGGLTLTAVARAIGPLDLAHRAPLTREASESTLAACGGNQSKAARRLGIDRGRLLRAMRPQKL